MHVQRIRGRDFHLMVVVALCVVCPTPVCAVAAAPDEVKSPDISAKVSHRIDMEPTYVETPRYALLVLGSDADAQVWMVEDGRKLYVDRNANDDLTDDGPPLEPTDERQWNGANGRHWDFDYVLDKITPVQGGEHTGFQLRRWNYGDEADHYGLSIKVGGNVPMYAGWFGTFWADLSEKAPAMHFGGPMEPRMLRFKTFEVGSGVRRLSMAFSNRSGGDGAVTMLAYEALQESTVPMLEIDWPVADGAPPLVEDYPLIERCCYWEFYESSFRVPEEAVPGTATVTVSFSDGAFPFPLTTNQIEVSVVAPIAGAK